MISIRGRFSYALKCVEIWFKENKLDSEIFYKILKEYAGFTLNPNLSEWYSQCEPYTPYYNLRTYKRFVDKQTHIPENKKEQINFYLSLSNDSINLLSLTFDIGREHLYQSINSDVTITYLDSIVSILSSKSIITPDFEKIIFSKFSEDFGWGKKFDWYSIWL